MVRTLTQMERVNFPPLHLPSASFVELKSRPLHQAVFNFRKFLKTWTPNKAPKCRCERWTQIPEAIVSTGHVMCHVRHIMPECRLASANLSDTMYLSERAWKHEATKELRKWMHRWKLPGRLESGFVNGYINNGTVTPKQSAGDRTSGHFRTSSVS